MTQFKSFKRTTRALSLLLALMMLLSVVSFGAVFADAAEKTVTISISNGSFILPPESITVSSGLASKYGYESEDDGNVSVFDAVAAVHEMLLGDEFTPDTASDYLEISDYGFVTKMLGEDASASSFFVNGVQPNDGVLNPAYGSYSGYTMDAAYLSDGDVVEVMFYQDTLYWSDYYSFFDAASASVRPDERLTLTLRGFSTFMGCYPTETIEAMTENLSDIQILVGTDKYSLSETEYVTDENGEVTLSFETAGTYYISAVSASDGYTYFMPPWCVVTVSDNDTEPTETATATPTETADAQQTATAAPTTDTDNIDIEDLVYGIAQTYYSSVDAWTLFDMVCGGYSADLTNKTDTMQALIDEAYSSTSLGTIAKNGLAINALGGDLTQLTTSDGTEFSLIETASNRTADELGYVTNAIFLLNMYDSGDFEVGGSLTRESVLDYILESRTESGIYGYSWGGVDYPDYDSTAMALNALAPYYETDDDIKAAVDTITSTLSEAQGENGSFGNANTDAMVIIGLTSVGIDPKTDTRFVKNDRSLLDGILSYALSDLSGFGYISNTEINALATEQGFRALISYLGLCETGSAYNIYEISPITAIYGDIPTNPDDTDDPSDTETITVSVSVLGDTVHGSTSHSGDYPTWIEAADYGLNEGATAADAIEAALTSNGYTAVGIESGYITSVTTPDGVTLSEFSNGSKSGWLYLVNGEAPTVGITSYTLEDGDIVVLYYTDDYTEDDNATKSISGSSNKTSSFSTGSSSGVASTSDSSSATATPTADNSDTANDTQSTDSYSDVGASHWAKTYIDEMTELGIIRGDGDGTFRPDDNVTRAECAAIMHRVANEKGLSSSADTAAEFSDVFESDWFFDDVSYAASLGIVLGDDTGRFMPNDNITREDICVMLDRLTELLDGLSESDSYADEFEDAADISDYAQSSVEKMRKSGVINGRENGNFDPKDSVTRAEVSKMIALGLFD